MLPDVLSLTAVGVVAGLTCLAGIAFGYLAGFRDGKAAKWFETVETGIVATQDRVRGRHRYGCRRLKPTVTYALLERERDGQLAEVPVGTTPMDGYRVLTFEGETQEDARRLRDEFLEARK